MDSSQNRFVLSDYASTVKCNNIDFISYFVVGNPANQPEIKEMIESMGELWKGVAGWNAVT